MSARNYLVSLLVASLCALAFGDLSQGEKDALKTKVKEIYKNVVFQRDFSRLNMKTELEGIQRKMLGKTRKGEEADCVRRVGKEGLSEGDALVDGTVGAAIPKLEEARATVENSASSEAKWSAAAALLGQTNYDDYIEQSTDQFDEKLPSFVQSKEKAMLRCLA